MISFRFDGSGDMGSDPGDRNDPPFPLAADTLSVTMKLKGIFQSLRRLGHLQISLPTASGNIFHGDWFPVGTNKKENLSGRGEIFIEYSFIVFFRQDDRSNLCLAIIKVNFEG